MRDEERELVYTQVLQKLVDELRNALESLLPELAVTCLVPVTQVLHGSVSPGCFEHVRS